MPPHLCQVGVLGLLLQQVDKAHAKLHHKVSELRLESLVELVGVPPHQLVHGLGHHLQIGLGPVRVAPGLLEHQPVDSLEVLPKLQPTCLQSFSLLRNDFVSCLKIDLKPHLRHLGDQLSALNTRLTPARSDQRQ